MRARRRALVPQASGRLLDLGGADSHRSLWDRAGAVSAATVLSGADDPHLARLAADDERFDTVVSVWQLASTADLDRTLAAIRSVLAEDGRILFVEPGAQAGVSGRLQRAVAAPLGGMTGWRADRDVPMALRAARLSVTDVRRHRVPTLQPWLRQVLEGSAHHALPPGGTSADPPSDSA